MNKIWMNAIRAAAAGGAAFSPADISGLVLDHDCHLISGNDGDSISGATFNSIAFSQATGAKQPVLKKGANGINGYSILQFNGAKAWRSTSAIDLSSYNALSQFVVAKVTSAASSRILTEFGTTVLASGSFGLNFDSVDKANFIHQGNVGISLALTNTAAIGANILYSGTYDYSLSTKEANGWINGTYNTTNPAFNTNNTSVFGNKVFYVGARNEASLYITADIARIILYNRALTTAERIQLEEYLITLYALDTTTAESPFADNGHPHVAFGTDKNPYIRTTSGARLVYSTDATTVDVTHYNDIYGTFPSDAKIGVRIDGVDYGTIAATAAGEQTESGYALGAGTKTVEFINGGQSSPSGGPPASVFGTFVRSLSFNSSATDITSSEPSSPRIWVYGDSITSGFNADEVPLEGWVQLLRNAYNGSVINDSWGYRALYRDASTAAARTDFAAYVATLSPSIIWLAIGTNDYGLSLWTAANFGTAYAALLDALHTVLPSATIYCQTPITRSVETANGVGSTMAQYRTEITTASNARSGYCVTIDGTAWTIALDDGVHPTTAGHATYAAEVISDLGL